MSIKKLLKKYDLYDKELEDQIYFDNQKLLNLWADDIPEYKELKKIKIYLYKKYIIKYYIDKIKEIKK